MKWQRPDERTDVQKRNDPQYNEVMFADKRAIDIHEMMYFRAIDGKVYRVWNVYVRPFHNTVAISVGCGWWNPNDVREWLPSVGNGMPINVKGYGKGIAHSMMANRVCVVDFEDGTQKNFNEAELLQLLES